MVNQRNDTQMSKAVQVVSNKGDYLFTIFSY